MKILSVIVLVLLLLVGCGQYGNGRRTPYSTEIKQTSTGSKDQAKGIRRQPNTEERR